MWPTWVMARGLRPRVLRCACGKDEIDWDKEYKYVYLEVQFVEEFTWRCSDCAQLLLKQIVTNYVLQTKIQAAHETIVMKILPFLGNPVRTQRKNTMHWMLRGSSIKRRSSLFWDITEAMEEWEPIYWRNQYYPVGRTDEEDLIDLIIDFLL